MQASVYSKARALVGVGNSIVERALQVAVLSCCSPKSVRNAGFPNNQKFESSRG